MRRLACPRCGLTLSVPAGQQTVGCPRCATVFNAPEPASDDVIDVQAVVLSEEVAPPDDPAPAAPPPTPPAPEIRTFAWNYEGQSAGGRGCCLLGCAGIFLILYLIVQGIMSLF